MSRAKNTRASNGRKDSITDEEKRIGSQKCILKAIQLLTTIDELTKRQVPMQGWVDKQLDEFVRARETDPFSSNQQSPSADVMLPPDYGFTSLVYETFFSQAVSWWSKAQHTKQQPDKILRKKMYASAAWYDHFMDRRNNLGSHLSNNERHRVPGDRWLIARGYFPFGTTVLTAFKYMLAESMSLLVPYKQKDETLLLMCLGAFGIPHANISDLQIPDPSTASSLSLVIKEPSPLLCHISPLPNGKWVCEAWESDPSGAIIQGGHYFAPPENSCDSPAEALSALWAKVEQEIT